MLPIIDVILPIFAIILAGYIAAQTRLFGTNASDILSRFVYYVAAPSLFFVSTYRTPAADFFNWPFLGALGGGMILTFCLSLIVVSFLTRRSITITGVHGACAAFPSTGYIGIPLLIIALGDQAIIPAIIGAVLPGILILPVTIILAEIDKSSGRPLNILRPIVGALLSPLVISAVVGITASGIGIKLSSSITTFFDLLGGAYSPSALFAAGLFIGCNKIQASKHLLEILWLVITKLLIQPALAYFLAYHFFGLTGILATAIIIQAALPTGVPVFVIAQRYDSHIQVSSASVVLSTALSVFSLSALLIFFEI